MKFFIEEINFRNDFSSAPYTLCIKFYRYILPIRSFRFIRRILHFHGERISVNLFIRFLFQSRLVNVSTKAILNFENCYLTFKQGRTARVCIYDIKSNIRETYWISNETFVKYMQAWEHFESANLADSSSIISIRHECMQLIEHMTFEKVDNFHELIPKFVAEVNDHNISIARKVPASDYMSDADLSALAKLSFQIYKEYSHSLESLKMNGFDTAQAFEISMVHGDLHQGNLMVDNNKIILIDFDKAFLANPFFDLMSWMLNENRFSLNFYNEIANTEIDHTTFHHYCNLFKMDLIRQEYFLSIDFCGDIDELALSQKIMVVNNALA